MAFTVKMAGIPFEIEAVYESTREYCRDYLTDEEPAFRIVSTAELIRDERRRSAEAGDTRTWSDACLETLAVYRQIAEAMTERDVILFHGSVAAVDGAAYLFTAPSGTGKSTHTRLWREVLPKYGHEVLMVNDDKPLIRFTKDGIFACGTPWNGKHHEGTNTMVPLAAVCRILQAPENEIRRLPAENDWPVLLRQCYRPEGASHLAATLRLLDRFSRELPLYELRCNMEPEAALVSFSAMSGQKI